MTSQSKHPEAIDYRPALYAIRNELKILTMVDIRRNNILANNFDRLNAAVDAVVDGIAAVAAAIRNPDVDTSDEAVIDGLASRLEDLLPVLAAAKVEEDAEDGGAAPSAEEPEAPAE